MSGYWGSQKYESGDRVPMKAVRCKSVMPGAGNKGHACRQHETHIGDHRCVCGEKWERTQAVVS